ncbi:MAG: hypothetical protein IIW91_05095 [Alistipes sp.]|jgi:hypothetical protein|nr:hypothetical protein [Alistipes sp.]
MALDEYVFSISDIKIKKTIVRGRTMVFYVALAIANNENVKNKNIKGYEDKEIYFARERDAYSMV